jgi:two-component sensor histidine kinase
VLAITSQRLEAGILNAPILIAEQSADLTYEWVSRGSLGRGPGWALGKADRDLLPDPPLETVVRSKKDVFDGKGPRAFEIDVEQDDGVHTYDVRVQPGRVTDRTVETIISVAVDVTERKLREDQIRLLMRELAHRVKNIFAVIRAITRQTYAFTSTRDDFSTRLLERLESLARSHDLLIEPQAAGTTLSEVVNHQLEHLRDLVGTQIHTDGATVHLRADKSQTVGLAIQELATNAVKYGALGQPSGQVRINWATVDGRVHMRWTESDGPPVHPPQRRGFGRTVLENMVPRALKGTVSMTFGDGGLVWELTFPLA